MEEETEAQRRGRFGRPRSKQAAERGPDPRGVRFAVARFPGLQARSGMRRGDSDRPAAFPSEVLRNAWLQGRGSLPLGCSSIPGLLRTKRGWPADGAAGIRTGAATTKSSPGARLGFIDALQAEAV